MTALAAPAPVPPVDAAARAEIESAIALEQAGRYGEAVERLSHALAAKVLSDADSARALFDRGLAYDGLGNMRAAVADYSAALRRDPSLSPALNNRADALRRAGRLAEAKRDYWAALKCPGGAREYPYYGLGLVAQQEGDREAARGFFQQALAANPNFALAAQSLAAVMDSSGARLIPAKTQSGLRLSLGDDHALLTSAAQPAEPLAPTFVAKPETAPPGTPVLVQLGAFQSEAIAHGAWEKISTASGDALRGLTPLVTAVDRPGRERLWRLRTAVAGQPAAQALCSALTQRQLACVVVVRGH